MTNQCQANVGASVLVGNCRAHIAQRQCSNQATNEVIHYHLIGTDPIHWKEQISCYCSTHTTKHRQRSNCWYPSWYKHAIITPLKAKKEDE